MNALGHNRPPGYDYADALKIAGEKKAAALRAKKLMERVYDRILLSTEGKTVAEREARARSDARFVAVEDEWLEAEQAAIQTKAEADAEEVRWETWRSTQATARAEMTLK